MPLVRTSVDVNMNFARVTQAVNQQARRAVTVAAAEGARAAASKASSRSKSGRMASMRVEPTRRSVDGWVGSFVSPVYYAWFQNYGTLGSRRKQLKQPPRTNRTRAPGTGVEPLGFLEEGKRVGRRALIRELTRGI